VITEKTAKAILRKIQRVKDLDYCLEDVSAYNGDQQVVGLLVKMKTEEEAALKDLNIRAIQEAAE